MPKGGRSAAAAHNAAVREAASPVTVGPPASEPLRSEERTDVRASARSAGSRSDRIVVAGTSAAVALATVGLVEAFRALGG